MAIAHGRPRGRKPKWPTNPAVQAALAKKKRDARRLASMTPEQRKLWRV